jgi:hypothetical protein
MTQAAGRVMETSSLILIRPSYRDIRITNKTGCIEIVCLWRAVLRVTVNKAMECLFSFLWYHEKRVRHNKGIKISRRDQHCLKKIR